jgi:hypothetical protein
MSSIQLSEDLLIEIQKTLVKYDENAQEMGIAVQYLSAIIGLLLANFKSHDKAQKQHLLQQLYGFAEHVMLDNAEEKPSAPANDEAFGIWKP